MHSYVTRISYATRMSSVSIRMLSVCHSYVLVCHPYVTPMYSVCHPYATRLWFNHKPSSADKFLIFYCGNSILYKKKRNENDKNTNFFWEKQKNAKKVYVNIKEHSLLWTHPTDPSCSILETCETRKKYTW